MSNPIPLSTPDGHVLAWACGACFNVPAGAAHHNGLEGQIEEAEHRRQTAESCCICNRCGAAISLSWDSICEACRPARDAEVAATIAKAQEAQKESEGLREASLRGCPDADAAYGLVDLMSSLSEDHWSAGWLIDCEFDLWRRVSGDTAADWGFSPIHPEALVKLRDLSEKSRGWWRWNREAGIETFVPIDAWLALYAEHEAKPPEPMNGPENGR